MAEIEECIGDWLFNKFHYFVVVAVVVCGVEYKIEK